MEICKPRTWINMEAVDKILEENSISYRYGDSHNMTDGEVHIIFNKKGDVYDFHGNYYDSMTWKDFLDWANK